MSSWSEKSSAASAAFSAIAAICALVISCQERPTPFKTALYTARWQSIETYAAATAKFEAELTAVGRKVAEVVDGPDLSKVPNEKMPEVATAAQPIFAASAEFVAKESAAMSPWSEETQAAMYAVHQAHEGASACYKILGERTARKGQGWSIVRTRAEAACGKFDWQSHFDKLSKGALRAMTDEARKASDQFVPGETPNLWTNGCLQLACPDG